MRAIRARYDPFEQARGRVEQIKTLGHSVDKVSLMELLAALYFLLTSCFRSSL